MCPKEAHEIKVLKETYTKVFGRNLDKDLEKEGGNLGKIFRNNNTEIGMNLISKSIDCSEGNTHESARVSDFS